MKPSEYKKLEADRDFKKYYLKKTMWWKSFLFFAPVSLMFIGLAGIMHMAYNDRIWTLYAIPYIIVFALGTIWLKGIKKHIQGKMLDDKERYLTCASRAIGDKNGRYYFIFSKDSKRHNEGLINKLAQELSIDSLTNAEINLAKKEIIEINTSEEETPIYLRAIQVSKVLKTNREKIREGITPLIYISSKDVLVIRNKDLI